MLLLFFFLNIIKLYYIKNKYFISDLNNLEQWIKPITSAKGRGWNGHHFLCVPHRSWGFNACNKIRQTCVSKVIVFCVTPIVPESFMIVSSINILVWLFQNVGGFGGRSYERRLLLIIFWKAACVSVTPYLVQLTFSLEACSWKNGDLVFQCLSFSQLSDESEEEVEDDGALQTYNTRDMYGDRWPLCQETSLAKKMKRHLKNDKNGLAEGMVTRKLCVEVLDLVLTSFQTSFFSAPTVSKVQITDMLLLSTSFFSYPLPRSHRQGGFEKNMFPSTSYSFLFQIKAAAHIVIINRYGTYLL